MNFKGKAPSKINIDNSMEWKKSKRASSGCSEAILEKIETGDNLVYRNIIILSHGCVLYKKVELTH